jgi:ArsR family transcriptional regulator, nickel/cobalt-responsive transcriptional repressor
MPADPPPDPIAPLDSDVAEQLAETMFALATPSRLQILACLRAGPLSVTQIIAAVGMEQSAVSHQLRVLRDHSAVSVERRGRERVYALRDEHVRDLLEDAHRHVLALRQPRRGPAVRSATSPVRRSAS